jgi:ribosome biogenesis GTPase / thiamine phosphate phosphatase
MELRSLGWSEYFHKAFQNYARAGMTPGRVLLRYNHIYTVATETGDMHAQCAGRLRHRATAEQLPATGDWIALPRSLGNGLALIHAVLPRRTCFSRKAAGRAACEQVIAANIDTAFLMIGLDNDYSPRRLERYLAATWESGAEPVVVLNKSDLCPDLGVRMAEMRNVAIGAPLHAIAALHGDGVEQLNSYCQPGRTIALLGSSGVGKTTLINRLLGSDALPTHPVREHDSRGRHTTTRRELMFLPGGAMVIDTPGLRELQLWDADEGVQTTFDQIEMLARDCRFRDCRHRDEPGCAVRNAVAAGELNPERLENLHKLQDELRWLDRRQDQGAALAEKRRWKTIHKAANRFQRESPKYRSK